MARLSGWRWSSEASGAMGEEALAGVGEAAGRAAGEALAAWRREHPRATLAELETAAEGALEIARARLLGELAREQEAAGAAGAGPHCGAAPVRRGRKQRAVLVAQRAAPLRLERAYWRCSSCGTSLFPLDEALGLVPGELGPRVLEGAVRLAARMPFAQAAEELAFFRGVAVSAETVRRATEAAGAAAVAVEAARTARLERELPAPPPGPPVQQVSVDGAMVPLVHGVWAEVKTMVIGTVGVADGTDGPAARTTDLSYFSRMAEAADFARQARGEVHRRGVQTAGTVVAAQDGAPWAQGVVDVYRRDAVRILDFPHAVEHLAAAAQAALGADPPACRARVDERAHTPKHDALEPALAALRALPTAAAAAPEAAATARDATLAYLEARREEVRYAAFQASGYPIGSGAVESAGKLVVEARLEGGGMHWAPDHVNPRVALRTVVCSRRWAAAWPAILQRLRRQGHERGRRRLQRHPSAPAPAPPKPPVHLSQAADRLRDPDHPKIIDGRPTSDHPRRRYAKAG
jgi:hypothetical protein